MNPIVAEAIANTIFVIASLLLLIILGDMLAELMHRRQLRKDEERQRILRRWRDAE